MRLLLLLLFALPTVAGSRPGHDFDALVEKSVAELSTKQSVFEKMIIGYTDFRFSQETGQLVLSAPKKPAVVADVQLVGTVSKRSKTWLWAWANDTMAAKLKAESRRVRAYGRQHSYSRLTLSRWPAERSDGWAMAAAQAHLFGADAAFRTPNASGETFMVLRNIHYASAAH
jgi:Family of unknown function (DUF6882)